MAAESVAKSAGVDVGSKADTESTGADKIEERYAAC